MNKKKLSHSNLNSSITSVLAALLCIVIGMAVGFLVLLAINPAHAWGDGFVRIVKGGFHDAPYGVGKELANAAPLIMTGLSVAFAFKTGLFNIGAAGQYTLGAYGALYCAIMLKMPWYVCLIVATILGGIWGAIPGFFKAYFNINEVITSIMFNWIGLYMVNDIMYGKGISRGGEVLDLAVDLDIIKKSGSWFSYQDQKLGQGRENAKKTLEDNPELMKEIEAQILEHKDELMASTKKKKKKSKLEEAAAKAAGENTEAPEDGGEVLEAEGEINSLEDGENLEISAEDDFEEFDPA